MSKQLILALAVGFSISTVAKAVTPAPTDVVLQDGYSTAIVDPLSPAGMYHWDVQGQNQLAQQWFWFRAGNMTSELPINALSATPVVQLGTGPTAGKYVSTTYDNGQFGVKIEYLLTGDSTWHVTGDSASADISETITILNHTGAPLPFHFFQYSDFDLNGAANDTTQIFPVGNKFVLADQTDNTGNQLTESQTTVVPLANHGEAALFGTTLGELNDGSATTLNDSLAPVGPGDTTWAMEWDLTIGAGSVLGPGSTIISKDKNLTVAIQPVGGGVPEPASLSLLACGSAALLIRRKRA